LAASTSLCCSRFIVNPIVLVERPQTVCDRSIDSAVQPILSPKTWSSLRADLLSSRAYEFVLEAYLDRSIATPPAIHVEASDLGA